MKISQLIFITLVVNVWTTTSADKFKKFVSKTADKIKEKVDKMVKYPEDVDLPLSKTTAYLAKNVLFGIPMEAGLKTVGPYCKTAKLLDSRIRKEKHFDDTGLKFIFKKPDGDIDIPFYSDGLTWLRHGFQREQPLVLFVSGWATDPQSPLNRGMAKAYDCRGGVNFVIIDASVYLQSKYHWAAFNCESIGRRIGQSLARLAENLQFRLFHLIGFSLGAHIIGAACDEYFILVNERIPHATALDAANPCFNGPTEFRCLSKNDAVFVDVIHTNPGAMGKRDPIGHLDIYANGFLPLQPGCAGLLCSHNRSWLLYAETVYPGQQDNFKAYKLNPTPDDKEAPPINIGYAAPHVEGEYFVSTNAKPPFGKEARLDMGEPVCAEVNGDQAVPYLLVELANQRPTVERRKSF